MIHNGGKSDDNSPRLYLNGELLKYKKSMKFLGITFDEHLSFKEHIEEIRTKCNKRLNLLKALCGKNWGATPETILYTYRSYIRPILEYSSILFAHTEENQLKQIQAIETKAMNVSNLIKSLVESRNSKRFFKVKLPG